MIVHAYDFYDESSHYQVKTSNVTRESIIQEFDAMIDLFLLKTTENIDKTFFDKDTRKNIGISFETLEEEIKFWELFKEEAQTQPLYQSQEMFVIKGIGYIRGIQRYYKYEILNKEKIINIKPGKFSIQELQELFKYYPDHEVLIGNKL